MEVWQCIYHLYILEKKQCANSLILLALFHILSYDAKENKIR